MPHRYSANRLSEGFALLATLWVLLIGTLLFGFSSKAALSEARSAAADWDRIRLAAAAESAVHMAIFRVLSSREHGNAALPDSATIRTDRADASASIRLADGLVDLNSANRQLVDRLLAGALPRISGDAVTRLRGRGAMVSYSQLAIYDWIGLDRLNCLVETATLFSGLEQPVASLASPWMRGLLGGGSSGKATGDTVAKDQITGRVVQVDAIARDPGGRTSRLLASVRMTGRRDAPFGVADWFWLPLTPEGSAQGCR